MFTTLESVDAAQAVHVQLDKDYRPFSRDKLLLSIYDSLKHRKTASEDATALTGTIMGQLYSLVEDATLERVKIITVTAAVLERFDEAAATSYRAFHPTD